MSQLYISVAVLMIWSQTAALSAAGDKITPEEIIGHAAPNWDDLPGVDGKKHSLTEIRARLVVVAFVANHCSLCEVQLQELNRIQTDYKEKSVLVVAISVSNSIEDRLPKMIERAKDAGYRFLYLHDSSQDIGRRFQVIRTPTIFLLNEKRRIVYDGALDDDLTPVKNHYLRDAVDAALEGRPIVIPKTRPIGCGIRYD